jgi:hypothetical protein
MAHRTYCMEVFLSIMLLTSSGYTKQQKKANHLNLQEAFQGFQRGER